MSAIATVAPTVAEEISLTQEVSDALDALELSEDSQDVSDTEEDVSDAEEDVSDAEEQDSDSEDAKEEAMNIDSSDSSSSTKDAVAQARCRISIQKSTIKAIQKAIRRDEEGATRIQCRVLKARAAHQAAELRLTIGRVTRTKESRVETTRHRLETAQQELYEMDERVTTLRRTLHEAHDRLPVLQLELEGARHAHKEAGRLRLKQRQQQYREQRLYQKERHAIGHLHPATEPSQALSLMVKLLSGELLTVEVHSADCVELLPRQFAEQHGYHLGVIPQMTFYVSEDMDAEEEDSKPKEPFVTGTTHLLGTRRTWMELFPHGAPMLLFLLKESNDYSRADKLRLMHDILRRRQLAAMMEDDDLWSLYQAWNIHCAVHVDANRWQKLSAFVDDHLPHFVPLTQEIIHQRERQARIVRRLHNEESYVTPSITSEEREILLRLFEEIRPFFPPSYPPLPSSFFHRYGSPVSFLRQILDICRQRQSTLSEYGIHCVLYTLRRHLVLSSFSELRIPPSSLCDCHEAACYICHYDQDSVETPQ